MVNMTKKMTTPKLIRGVALVLLPILLYYILFIIFEPYNYFGLRRQNPPGAVFGAIRSYDKDPVPGVFIGDSRFANLDDMDALEAETGKRFANLSYMGSSMQELLDETEWLLQTYPGIDTVVFDVSFYLSNTGYKADRWDFVEMALANPVAYMSNLSFNLEAMQNLKFWLGGEPLGGGEAETRDPATYEWVNWQAPTGETVRIRQDIVKYLESISVYTTRWNADTESHARLRQMIEDYSARGVHFIIVLPPTHDAVLHYAMQPYGIDTAMLPLIEALRATPADVLDYELTARPDYPDDWFFDGFHLDYQRGLPQWQAQLYQDLGGLLS